ncbi:MAG: hypothetical protein U1E46_11450 [Hyphomicrobiales bacterium]
MKMSHQFVLFAALTVALDFMLFDGANVSILSRYGQTGIDRVLNEIDGQVLGLLG